MTHLIYISSGKIPLIDTPLCRVVRGSESVMAWCDEAKLQIIIVKQRIMQHNIVSGSAHKQHCSEASVLFSTEGSSGGELNTERILYTIYPFVFMSFFIHI